MDQTFAALTIHPAAWAALFQGLAENIAYGLAIGASVLVAAMTVIGGLAGRGDDETTLDGPAVSARDLAAVPTLAPGGTALVPALVRLRRPQPMRRRPRPVCRRIAWHRSPSPIFQPLDVVRLIDGS